MRDDVDERVHDAVALDEIDLYADVLGAVAVADRRLTDEELDAVLGLAGLPCGGRSGPLADGSGPAEHHVRVPVREAE